MFYSKSIMAALFVVASFTGLKGYAMGQAGTGTYLRVACELPVKSSVQSQDVCALFIEVLQEEYPEAEVSQSELADVRLVVTAETAQRFSARIDWSGVPGNELGTARAGAVLNDAARVRFLRTLLRATPRP